METILRQTVTRDGAPLTIRRVVAPDPLWAERIMPFLGHKGPLWLWQLKTLLTEPINGLGFRSYLAELPGPAGANAQGELAGHLCTIESQDVGLFGHVYTDPAHRGRSIARLLTEACVADFQARSGQALWLVTGYDSTPYRVYRQFGFDSIQPGDGIMVWFSEGGRAELERRFSAGQSTAVRPMAWPDYATLNALSCWPAGPPRRSTVLRVIGQNIVEQSFLELQRDRQRGQPIQAVALATAEGWPVGWAIARDDSGQFVPHQEPRPPIILDLYAHPNYQSEYGRLLIEASLPADRRVITQIDSLCQPRQDALAKAGFEVQGRLPGLFAWRGRPADMIVMVRQPQSG